MAGAIGERALMSRPRVIYWDNLPTPYGIARYNTLAERGTLDFSVWFSRRTEPGRSWTIDESTWCFDGQYVEDPSESLAALHRFAQRCDVIRPDLVVSQYGEPGFAAGLLIMKGLGLRTALVVERTFDAVVRRAWWKEAAKAVLFRAADAAQVHGPPAAVRGTSETDSFHYAYRYGFTKNRTFGVTHSFDLQLFGAPVDLTTRAAERARLGVSGCVLLYVGRLIEQKGLRGLLKAYREARVHHADLSLVLVGDGVDEGALRASAAGLDRVVFAPFAQPCDLPRYYAAADAFVFPTTGDPFGLVLEEAHATGLPVITTDAVGDVRHRILDRTGFVVPVGDMDRFAEKILELARNPGLRVAMGAAGAARVRDWGHTTWADDFERFATRAVATPRRRTSSARLVAAAGAAAVAVADVAARARIWRQKARGGGLTQAVAATLRYRANCLGMRAVSLAWRMRRPRVTLRRFGTEYHGWTLPVQRLTDGGVCYSVGVGEDTSLEDELLRRTSCRVWSFDPTPRAIAHVQKQDFDPARFTFRPLAVWDRTGQLPLFAHPDPACDTFSPTNLWQTNVSIDVPCTTIADLMRAHGHTHLLLLKINIGGGEWRVLEHLLHDPHDISILCVEFCQPAPFWRIARMARRLRDAGYTYHCHDRWKFTFVRESPSAEALSRARPRVA